MNSPKSYKKQVILLLVALLVLEASFMVFVAYLDPLLCTSWINDRNRVTPVIDSRLQKTSSLFLRRSEYDALLIGSSRVEQLRQQDFAPYKIFNYGLPSLYPDEYRGYIDFFLHNHSSPRKIFIGLDFCGTSSRMYQHAKQPEHYISTCTSLLYVPKALVSRNARKYALKMARGKRDQFSYDRITLDKLTKPATSDETAEMVAKQMEIYRRDVYAGYVYNADYRATLAGLRERYQKYPLVIFTTPETENLFRVLVEQGRVEDYLHWLKDIVDVFGEVYDLTLPGSFAADQENFLDAHHLYPDKTAAVTAIITGKGEPIPGVIGAKVTRANLAHHLDLVVAKANELRRRTQQSEL